MSQVQKSNEEFIKLFKSLIEQFKAIPTSDAETTTQMICHCEMIIKYLQQNPNVPPAPTNPSVKEEPHHYYCQCDRCGMLTGCDR